MVLVKNTLELLFRVPQNNVQVQQVRHKFTDWRMLRDYKRRQTLKEYGKEKLRINALRKNRILPPELQAMADEEMAKLPRQSSITQTVSRCAVTSRAHSTITEFRVSRIVFRHLADYNKLAGVKKASW